MTRIARFIYTLFAWLFVAGIMAQVFFAGMAVVARRWPWSNHIELGFALALPILVLAVFAFLGRFAPRIKLLSGLLPVVYIVQVYMIWSRSTAPVLSAFHPVMALLDFGLGLYLALAATAVLRADIAEDRALPKMEVQAGD